MNFPFSLETDLEREIAADPEWQQGIVWGKPRAGHMEGAVMYHIADVLANIDSQAPDPEERRALRLIALLHDTFKYRVDESRPRIGNNHHAYLARVFAARYIPDSLLLDIIEMHDEAYHSWRIGFYKGKWHRAQERMDVLRAHLGNAFALYIRFFYADSTTDSKDPAPMAWVQEYLEACGETVPPGSYLLQ